MDARRGQYFAEDIRWHLPRRNLLTGAHEGVAQVLEAFGRVFELSEGQVVGCRAERCLRTCTWGW